MCVLFKLLSAYPDCNLKQRHYRESEIYLFRFQQCMIRAMTLIKMYFVGSFRALTIDVSKRLSEKVSAFHFTKMILSKSETRTSRLLRKHTYFTRGSRVFHLS
jgi:hypothetical protein